MQMTKWPWLKKTVSAILRYFTEWSTGSVLLIYSPFHSYTAKLKLHPQWNQLIHGWPWLWFCRKIANRLITDAWGEHRMKKLPVDVARTWKMNWHKPDALPVAKLEETNRQAGHAERFGSRLPCCCMTWTWCCRTSTVLPEAWDRAATQLHSGALTPFLTDQCASLPAARTMALIQYKMPSYQYMKFHCRDT